MALTTIGTASIDAEAITEPKLAVTGTGSTSNFLRGDMSWSAPDGDIAGVTAGTGLNGGGTSGTITVNLDTTLPNDTVISTTGAITTTGAFTSIGIDDNADALAVTITSGEDVGIGTTTVPYGTLAIDATNVDWANGPHISLTTAADDYPIVHIMAYQHDTAAIRFDSYYAGAQYSSDAGSNYMIAKENDLLSFQYDSGITAGQALTWNTAMAIDTSGVMNLYDNVLLRPMMKDYSETKVAMAAHAVDLSLGNVQTYTLSGSQTLTFTNPIATGNSSSFTLLVTNGGSATLTWPTSVDWAAATAPTLTSSGIDVLTFTTIDGGTIWYGFLAGAEMG